MRRRKAPDHPPPYQPQRNERWDTRDGSRTARVMCAPVEGYIMARYKGAGPFLLHINDWHKKFTLRTPTPGAPDDR